MESRPFVPPSPRSASDADEVWSLLADLALRQLHTRYADTFERLGLTPPEARLLYFLDSDRAVTQRDLAASMGCSPSYITGLVDRLEERGIVQRRVDPRDRRANTLSLTTDGLTIQSELGERLHSAPSTIAALPPAELHSLRDLLRRLLRELDGQKLQQD